MENVTVNLKDGNIIITIPVSSIIEECSNADWLATHSISPIKKDIDSQYRFSEYITDALDETSIDMGIGYVTPVANMIMEIVAEACCDAEDFFVDEFDDE